MEGRVGRFLARFGQSNPDSESSKNNIRTDETKRTLRYSANRYNNAMENLNTQVLSNETRQDINIAVSSALSTQRAIDEIYWKRALLESGLPLGKVNEVCERRDELELEIETKFPLFETRPQDYS